MGFLFYRKLGAIRGYEAELLFQRGIRNRWSFDTLQRAAHRVGLSYRRKDMEYDFRRSKAMMPAKTITSREHAGRFFEKFYEPLRVKHGWTSAKTTEFFRRGRLGMLDTIEEMEEYDAMMKGVEEEFPELYG